jgi:hypothetical protein
MVTRTYRAAIRIGEDFITLEETIALPIDASDAEVAQAVELGWRIYRAQREAAEAQIADVREHTVAPPAIVIRDPESPASEKQRQFISTLQDTLGWNHDQLTSFAQEQRIDLLTLTKGRASTFIDDLKRIAEERTPYGETNGRGRSETNPAPVAPVANNAPANEKQLAALERLENQGHDVNGEARRRFDTLPRSLSHDQAAALIAALQPRRRVVTE